MVRTRRSIEEEARVMLVAGPGTDAFLADGDLAGQMEGDVLDELIEWGTETSRRALVVGLEDRGRIALEFARRGVFVTVVEPDESLHEPVKAAAEAEHCLIRINFFASDYMKREFATSGFDLAIFYSALSRYNEPLVVLKKAARELRAGGRVFARIKVRPAMGRVRNVVGPVLKKADAVPGVSAARARVRGAVERLPLASRVIGLPDAAHMLDDIATVFKIEKVDKRHLLAPLVGWAGAATGTGATIPEAARVMARKVLPAALKVDDMVIRAAGDRLMATHLCVYGTKELGLGRTFRV